MDGSKQKSGSMGGRDNTEFCFTRMGLLTTSASSACNAAIFNARDRSCNIEMPKISTHPPKQALYAKQPVPFPTASSPVSLFTESVAMEQLSQHAGQRAQGTLTCMASQSRSDFHTWRCLRLDSRYWREFMEAEQATQRSPVRDSIVIQYRNDSVPPSISAMRSKCGNTGQVHGDPALM